MSIWGFAFGYFLCYAPYSALTKALSDGAIEGMTRKISGFELLPITGLASLAGMLLFLGISGWWRYASRVQLFGLSIPAPTRWTFLSGLCSSTIIATTTLAYTFTGASIVFMMLLMRGGVLVIAPVVDALSGRRVQWFSWAALGLSLGAGVVAFLEKTDDIRITVIAGIDVAAYLGAYFIRLRFMSRLAKSAVPGANIRFFVEEHLVATPMMLLGLGVCALLGEASDTTSLLGQVAAGFTTFFDEPVVWQGIVIGLFSEGTGVFGGLILLDKRENTFSVPVNRSSSILAGVVASYALTLWLGHPPPSLFQLAGAGLIIGAILFLTVPQALARARASRLAARPL